MMVNPSTQKLLFVFLHQDNGQPCIHKKRTIQDLDSLLLRPCLTQPSRAQDHRQAQKNGQTDPGDAIQCGFCTAGAAEHGAPACGQASHAAAFGAVKQHQYDQQYAGADPGPGQDRSEH